MKDQAFSQFMDYSIPQDLSSGGRFDVMDENMLWLAQEGDFDVFLTAAESEHSALHHFIRINQGELFVGIHNIPDNWKCVARVCSNTTVVKILKKDVIEMPRVQQDYICDKIDNLISLVSKTNIIEILPKRAIDLSVMPEIRVEAQDCVFSAHNVKWVITQDSLLWFLGDSGAIIDTNEYFPISIASWVEAPQAARINALATQTLIQDALFWNYLNQFLLRVLQLNLIHIENLSFYDNIMLFNKVENNQLAIHHSVHALSNSFYARTKHSFVYEQNRDPYFVACKYITSYLDVPLIPLAKKTEKIQDKSYFRNIMAYSKLFYRKVSLEPGWSSFDHGPILALKKDNHQPVAILPEFGNHYVEYSIENDLGERIKRPEEARFESNAFVIYNNFGSKLLNLRNILKPTIDKTLFPICMVFFCSFLGSALGLSIPVLTQYIFDNVIVTNEKTQLIHLFLILIGIIFSIGAFELTKRFILLNLETKFDCDIHAAFWDRILKLPIKFFQNFSAGELASRIGNLVQIRLSFAGATLLLFFDTIFTITSFFLLFYYQFKLAACITVFVVGILLAIKITLKKRINIEEKVVVENAKIYGMLSGFFLAITKIRLAGGEYRVFLNWANAFSFMHRLLNQSQKWSVYTKTLIDAMPLFVIGIMYLMIGLFFSQDLGMSTGAFLAFNIALGQIVVTLYNALNEISRIVETVPLYNKTKMFIEEMPETKEGDQDPGEILGEIELNKVSFKYENSPTQVLNNVSLRIGAGEYVAFVGKSGSGKSSLLRLLVGFENPTSGKIYYDSKDLTNFDKNLFRRQLGVVLQHDELIPGNLYRNISGISELTMEEAWEVAHLAGIGEDIIAMPMQMYTSIDLDGAGLSGGQKQRIMIARALARKPKILMLDEATRALDNISQRAVIDSLSKLKITRIVVAHRLSTLLKVDRIFVLNEGRICEEGSYEELLLKKGIFYELVKKQLVF